MQGCFVWIRWTPVNSWIVRCEKGVEKYICMHVQFCVSTLKFLTVEINKFSVLNFHLPCRQVQASSWSNVPALIASLHGGRDIANPDCQVHFCGVSFEEISIFGQWLPGLILHAL